MNYIDAVFWIESDYDELNGWPDEETGKAYYRELMGLLRSVQWKILSPRAGTMYPAAVRGQEWLELTSRYLHGVVAQDSTKGIGKILLMAKGFQYQRIEVRAYVTEPQCPAMLREQPSIMADTEIFFPKTGLDSDITDLQKKAVEIAGKYEKLSLQKKISVIAQAFGCNTGKIVTSPCSGKWRGTSDIFIKFDNGTFLFIGNRGTPKAKTINAQMECVSSTLVSYNPEIIAATKEIALAALLQREAQDNAVAVQKGLKPYTLLGVEFNNGTDHEESGYMGWYYVMLAIDGKLHAHMETGLNHDIASGKVSKTLTRKSYYTAGALKEADVDYVFNNVGFSSASNLYTLPIGSAVRERAEKVLAEREKDRSVAETPVPEQMETTMQDTFSIYQLRNTEKTRNYHFEPYGRLKELGLAVDQANYDLVYTAPLDKKCTLEDIYCTFNISRPADFKGHSLSMSDVVVLCRGNQQTAYYCDSFGFQEVPEFMREKSVHATGLQ